MWNHGRNRYIQWYNLSQTTPLYHNIITLIPYLFRKQMSYFIYKYLWYFIISIAENSHTACRWLQTFTSRQSVVNKWQKNLFSLKKYNIRYETRNGRCFWVSHLLHRMEEDKHIIVMCNYCLQNINIFHNFIITCYKFSFSIAWCRCEVQSMPCLFFF